VEEKRDKLSAVYLFGYLITKMLTKFLVMISPFDLPTIRCDCTDLVVRGQNLSSNVGYPRFSPLISSMISLSQRDNGIIVGLVLSDALQNRALVY
jgi:hypothetical protein